MLRVRTSSLAVVAAALLASCTKSAPAPALSGRSAAGGQQTGVVATFTGVYDPATGKLSIRTAAPEPSDPGALSVFLPFSDGAVGTGPVSTFELVTDPGFAPTVVASDCGGTNAFEGDVTVRSFFRNQSMKNVYAELTNLSPSGHASCNSDSASGTLTSLNTGYGLWSYGNLDPDGTPSVAVTKRWKFRYASDEAFTFQGRIWATLAAPVPRSGDPEFNWYATSLVDPPRSFLPVATTVSHIVWNGTGWTDAVGGATFVQQGTGGGSENTGLSDTVQPYATFSTGEYWTFTPTGAQTATFELAGDFTVCAKFKPGVLPPEPHPPDHIKTFFSKGNPTIGDATHLGWSLMEMNAEYCFHYRTPTSTVSNEVMAARGPPLDPQTFTYDYMCGGRAGTALWVGIGGVVEVSPSGTVESGSFAGTNIPLSIGAFADGTAGAGDIGVYEIIIDSRPPVPGVMAEIVGLAEGRLLPGIVNGVATIDSVNATSLATFDIDPLVAVSTAVAGADGQGYVLPTYATVPLAPDGSGLLPAGTRIIYTHPLFEDTRTTGFCAGFELVATGPWANVSGALFGFQDGDVKSGLFAPGGGNPGAFAWSGNAFLPPAAIPGGWADGTAHVFEACADPASGTPIALYIDGTPGVVGGNGMSIPDLSNRTQNFAFGSVNPGQFNAFGGPLSGARIRRVFICPDPNPASCN